MAKHSILYIISFFLFNTFICETVSADNKPFVVVLDAGHGGKDPGAIGSNRSNREKDINLGIVLEVGKLLKNKCPDVKVIYTRSTDVFIGLDQRANIANKAKADLFISVHTNALPKNARKATGVQSYTLTLNTAATNLEVEKRENSVIQFEENGEQKYSFCNPNSSESDIIFELMQDRDMAESVNFAKLAQNEMVRSGGRHDMGVLQANLAVLRLTYMPSVLLEVGYISTPSEEKFLLSKSGQTTMAKCIYNAIAQYKSKHTGRMSALEKITPNNHTEQMSVAETPQTALNQPEDEPAQKINASDITSASQEEKAIFKIQIMAATRHISPNDKQFKGLSVEEYKVGNSYKYTYGATSDYKEILDMKKKIASKFPQAFIVAFKNGEKIETSVAINEYNETKRNKRL